MSNLRSLCVGVYVGLHCLKRQGSVLINVSRQTAKKPGNDVTERVCVGNDAAV